MTIVGRGTMNRRNFVLGLGTAATLSGAASVTGASLASTTDVSNTDFRVFAQAALEANGTFTGDDGVTNSSGTSIVNASGDNDIDYSGIETTNFNNDFPLATAGGSTTTNDLSIEVAFSRTADGRKDGLITINNTGSTDEDVGIVFQSNSSTAGFGTDVGTSDGPTAQSVVDTIQFEAEDSSGTETVISPTSVTGASDTTQDPANRVTVPAGGSKTVDVNFNSTTEFESGVEGNVSASGNPFDSGGIGSIDLIDAILIGTGNA